MSDNPTIKKNADTNRRYPTMVVSGIKVSIRKPPRISAAYDAMYIRVEAKQNTAQSPITAHTHPG